MNNDTASQFKVLPQFTKRHADPVDHDGEWYGVIQGPEFAYDVFAPAGETGDGFREVLECLAGNASLKAEVERLRAALVSIETQAMAPDSFSSVEAFARYILKLTREANPCDATHS